jgi:hypothetical protein
VTRPNEPDPEVTEEYWNGVVVDTSVEDPRNWPTSHWNSVKVLHPAALHSVHVIVVVVVVVVVVLVVVVVVVVVVVLVVVDIAAAGGGFDGQVRWSPAAEAGPVDSLSPWEIELPDGVGGSSSVSEAGGVPQAGVLLGRHCHTRSSTPTINQPCSADACRAADALCSD